MLFTSELLFFLSCKTPQELEVTKKDLKIGIMWNLLSYSHAK